MNEVEAVKTKQEIELVDSLLRKHKSTSTETSGELELTLACALAIYCRLNTHS